MKASTLLTIVITRCRLLPPLPLTYYQLRRSLTYAHSRLPKEHDTCRRSQLVQVFAPFKPSRCIKATFYIPEIILNFPTTKGFRTKISIKLIYQYMVIFFNFSPTLSHLYPLQVENCNSNPRLVGDEDDNGKLRPERVKRLFNVGSETEIPGQRWCNIQC